MKASTTLNRLSTLALGLAVAVSSQSLQAQTYDLDLLGTNPAIPTIPLFSRGTSIRYLSSSRVGLGGNEKLLQLRLADGLLCGDFSGESGTINPNPLRLRLLDVNGRVIDNAVRPGSDFALDSFGPLLNPGAVYKQKLASPNTRALQITIDETRLVCRHLRTQIFTGGYSLTKQFDGASSDFIFADRFEATPVSPPPNGNCATGGTGPDIGVSIELPAGITGVRGTQPLTYLIRVSNNSAQSVSGIQVRDFFYGTAAQQPNIGIFQITSNNVWNCNTGNCGTLPADRNGNVYLSSVALSPGQSAVVQVTRPWVTSNGGADLNNVPFGIAAAAFTSNESAAVRDPNRCNDVAVFNRVIRNNLPPTLTSLPSAPAAVLEDTGAVPFNFSISDPDGTAASSLSTTVSSSPGGIVNASISGSGANRTLTITPIAQAFGSTTIRVTARDPEGDESFVEFPYTVSAVNDQPSFDFNIATTSACPGVFTPEVGATPATLSFATAPSKLVECATTLNVNFGPNESSQIIAEMVDRTITPNGVIAFPSTAITPDGKNVRISFGVNGPSGIATIRFKIRDNGGTASGGVDLSAEKTLRIRVPSQVPTITQLAAQSTNEDTPLIRALTITDPDSNPATFATPVVTSSNPALIAPSDVSFGGAVVINPNEITRNVTLTPKLDQSGSATIRITVTDGDGSAFTEFTLSVNPINDAPFFNAPLEINLPAGSAAGKGIQIAPFATGMSVGPANEIGVQSLDFFSVSVLTNPTNQVVEGTPNVAVGSGNMLITLKDGGGGVAPNGASCIRVRLFDSGSNTAPNVNNFARIVKVRVGGGDVVCPAN